MKILFINTTGGYFGGVEQNIALSAKGLSLAGHTCYFACMENSGIDQGKLMLYLLKPGFLGQLPLHKLSKQFNQTSFISINLII